MFPSARYIKPGLTGTFHTLCFVIYLITDDAPVTDAQSFPFVALLGVEDLTSVAIFFMQLTTAGPLPESREVLINIVQMELKLTRRFL